MGWPQNPRCSMDETLRLIRELHQQRFYGSLTLKFEAGEIVVVKKEETIKPANYRDNRGVKHESEKQ